MANRTTNHRGVPHTDHPPEAWPAARRLAQRALAPVERFLRIEAASGILLLAAAALALAWANSPWQELYTALWHTPFGVKLGALSFERDLHFWINDGLMTVFFFVVGLEIRREMHKGELSSLARAALPLVAALGGMLAPACIYAALNLGRASFQGWGIPMATDIAFAVGVLALLGKRVAPALRILLLALAVIDDVGAILVIAVFYTSELQMGGLLVSGMGLAAILAMQKVGARNPWAYVPPAAVVWAGAYACGIHPTLAGVVVGLVTPAQAWLGPARFIESARANVEALVDRKARDENEILPHLDEIDQARREAVSPVERMQHALHGWVAFGVMPVFALANAGVTLGAVRLEADGLLVFLGVCGGLVLGKPTGILALSWLCTRLGLTALPRGVGWLEVGLVGLVAGIGFTMALFIAQLAFPPGALLESAKLGILSASAIAGVAGLALGRWALPAQLEPECAATAEEAERSTLA